MKFMKVVVTGASNGIGKAIVERFLHVSDINWGISKLAGATDIDLPYFEVHGLDIAGTSVQSEFYFHHICDVSRPETLPDIEGVSILINNAGVQDDHQAIKVNLLGAMNVTDQYIDSSELVSILNVCSVSAHNGAEFPAYTASKGGLLAYTRHIALQVADRGIVCNSISPGGVKTRLNDPVMDDPKLWDEIMHETPLKKWMSPEEVAEWVEFLTVKNKSMTGQDIIIDNGETINCNFVWPDK